MRLARTLVLCIYASTAIVALAVLTAPWWRPADGDLAFGFLMGGLIALWLQLTLALALVALLIGLWAVTRANGHRAPQHLLTVGGAVLALAGLGTYAWFFFRR